MALEQEIADQEASVLSLYQAQRSLEQKLLGILSGHNANGGDPKVVRLSDKLDELIRRWS